MRIGKSKAGNARVFRPEGGPAALPAAEKVKDALEGMGATDTRFAEF